MGLELAKAFIRVRADSSRLGPDFRAVKGIVTSQVAKLTALVGGGLSAATAVLATKKALGLAADLETTTVAFTTMLGSGEAAKKMLEDIQKFAAATPFEMPGLQGAARTLLAFGFAQEDIMPTLKTLGDVSAGTGKDLKELAVIFGQIKSAGRLMGQDLLQLINAGFNPLQIISEQTGRSMADLKKDMEAGKIGFDQVLGAFQAVTSEGGMFFNMMEEQSKTLSGRISTLKDNINAVFREIGLALMPAAKEAVETLMSVVEGNQEAFANLGKRIGEFAQTTVTWLKVLIKEWRTAWDLIKVQTMVVLSGIGDFFVNLWRGLPKIPGIVFGIMKEQFMLHLRNVKSILTGVVNLFQNSFVTIKNMWAAVWNDDSVMDEFKKGVGRQAELFMQIGKDVAKNTTESAKKQFEMAQKGLKSMGLGEKGEETKILEGMRDELAGKLGEAFAKASADAANAPETKELGEKIAKPVETAIEQAASGIGMAFGRFGLAEFGRKVQDMALKGDKDDKMIGLLEFSNKIQEQMLKELQKNPEITSDFNFGLV